MEQIVAYAENEGFLVLKRNLDGEELFIFRLDPFQSGEIKGWKRGFMAKFTESIWQAYFHQTGTTKPLTNQEMKSFITDFKSDTFIENIEKYK